MDIRKNRMTTEILNQQGAEQEAIVATVGKATVRVMLAGEELNYIEPEEAQTVAQRSAGILLNVMQGEGIIERPIDSRLVIVAIRKATDAEMLNSIIGIKE